MEIIKNSILTSEPFYPEAKNIFNVFRMPLDAIKVVILGQDPYPKGEGIGYSFAVNKYTTTPPSLNIIIKEIVKSGTLVHPENNMMFKEWKELVHWRQQGVFLLNTALTVRLGVAGSHVGYWKWFTEAVVGIISRNNPCVWLLWGTHAKSYKDFIAGYHAYNPHMGLIRSPLVNYYFEGNHPAAEVYPDSKYKFVGCNHFNLCNHVLVAKQLEPIKW